MKTLPHLPQEIISQCIMPFCYCPQPPELLQDIRSFTEDYKVVKNCSLLFLHVNSDDEDEDTLITLKNAFIVSFFYNIINFCNDEKDVREIPTVKFGDILRRHIKYKNNYSMEIYDHVIMAYHLPNSEKERFGKYLWGLLIPRERTGFINKYYIDKFDN